MKTLSIAFLILASMTVIRGQIGVGPVAFYADYAYFASATEGKSQVEIYYQIYNSRLSYILQDGKYVASYAVSAVIYDGDKQVTAKEKEGRFLGNTYEDTQDRTSSFLNLFRFDLEPGNYLLKMTLTDLNGSNILPIETKIEVPDYSGSAPMFSSIFIARSVDELSDSASTFDRGGMKVLPSCSRRLGDGTKDLIFYYETYNFPKDNDSTLIVYEIINERQYVDKSDTIYKNTNEASEFIDSIRVTDLSPGSYWLILKSPIGRDGKDIVISNHFKITWSALEMVANNFDAAVDQLYYIASTKEMNQIRNATEEQKLNEWNYFWESRDPTPGTKENEIKAEYYRRLAVANQRYSLPIKEGWKTDMGMVFITYGEPDDIERHPFDIDYKPYQIWYYYDLRKRFHFVDNRGAGEYELQFPYDGDMNKDINLEGGRP